MRDDAHVQNSSARGANKLRPAFRPLGEAAALSVQHARAMMSSPVYWPVVLISSGLCATTGPFDTFEALSLVERLFLWTPLVVGTVVTFTLLAFFIRALDNREVTQWYLRAALTATFGLLPVALMAFGMTTLLDVYSVSLGEQFLTVVSRAVAPVYSLTFLVYFLIRRNEEREEAAVWLANEKMARLRITQAHAALYAAKNETESAPQAITQKVRQSRVPLDTQSKALADAPVSPPNAGVTPGLKPPGALLFERLPPELGTDIVTLQAQNHHTIVTTQLGTAKVFMRIGDAEADLAGLPCGMRVHRSWWVNLAHVVGISPRGASIELTLDSGEVIPVGRSQRAPVRKAVEEFTDQLS